MGDLAGALLVENLLFQVFGTGVTNGIIKSLHTEEEEIMNTDIEGVTRVRLTVVLEAHFSYSPSELHGMAIDVRVAGRYTEDIRWIAMGLHRGGVGYYPNSNFVHMDVGPVRYW